MQTECVRDSVAERLEQKALWRRAATRWLDVLQLSQSETKRDWVIKRRLHCLSMVVAPGNEKPVIVDSRPSPPHTENVGA
ncbi:ANR family transcriptional regulator [Enterobacter mori]|uniref:ANR family transcriptional regulator n=1 Tax=Enterobacter mori TaxID=539813 RepID=UPI003B83BFD2